MFGFSHAGAPGHAPKSWTSRLADPRRSANGVRRITMPRTAKSVPVQSLIDRMVKRIVKNFRPEKIILFGSHARGEAGPDSDVDLLVVMPVQGSVVDKRL